MYLTMFLTDGQTPTGLQSLSQREPDANGKKGLLSDILMRDMNQEKRRRMQHQKLSKSVLSSHGGSSASKDSHKKLTNSVRKA